MVAGTFPGMNAGASTRVVAGADTGKIACAAGSEKIISFLAGPPLRGLIATYPRALV